VNENAKKGSVLFSATLHVAETARLSAVTVAKVRVLAVYANGDLDVRELPSGQRRSAYSGDVARFFRSTALEALDALYAEVESQLLDHQAYVDVVAAAIRKAHVEANGPTALTRLETIRQCLIDRCAEEARGTAAKTTCNHYEGHCERFETELANVHALLCDAEPPAKPRRKGRRS